MTDEQTPLVSQLNAIASVCHHSAMIMAVTELDHPEMNDLMHRQAELLAQVAGMARGLATRFGSN